MGKVKIMQSEKVTEAAIKSNIAYYDALWKARCLELAKTGDTHNRWHDKLIAATYGKRK